MSRQLVGKAFAILALAMPLLATAPAPAPAPQAVAVPPTYDPAPWIEDLAEMQAALTTRYANLPWLLTEREVDLDALFLRARNAVLNARDDAGARRIFDRIAERIDDGHVRVEWPRPPAPTLPITGSAKPTAATATSFCAALGYHGNPGAEGMVSGLPGYEALWSGDVLPGGTFAIGGARGGAIRVDKFDPHGSPSLCEDAVGALRVPLDRPCDEACDNAILTFAYRKLTAALEQRLVQLQASGASVLAVDITGNGGGSEWAEVAARMLSSRPITSARHGFVRGPHWERLWSDQAKRLRGFAAKAKGEERAALLDWAATAEAATAEARRRCPPTGDPECPWLASVGYSTGLVGRVPAGRYADRDWGVHVFNPGQHPYRDGVWPGPVMVLTDEETWSAAEQFAAVLQDNRAAVIVGSRTGGAGCGYSWGGAPARLSRSGAILHLPDCARFRADGTNEVRGIMPDVPISWRANDGRAMRSQMLGDALAAAAERARRLHSEAPPALAPPAHAGSPQSYKAPGGEVVLPDAADRVAHEEMRFAATRRSGDDLYISGLIIGRRPDEGRDEAALREQVRRGFARMQRLLAANGLDFTHVSKINSYHLWDSADFAGGKDAQFRIVSEVLGEFAARPYPAWTAVGTTALLGRGGILEIEAIAYAGQERRP